MGDPKICSERSADQAAEANFTAQQAAQEAAGQTLPIPIAAQDSDSTFLKAPPPLICISIADRLQAHASRFGATPPTYKVAPSNLDQAIREVGINPEIAPYSWPNDRIKGFVPKVSGTGQLKLELIPSTNPQITEFESGPLRIGLLHPMDNRQRVDYSTVSRAIATYDKYEKEIPVAVVTLRNGTRLLALGGEWRGVLFFQGGEKLEHVSEVSAKEMRREVLEELGLVNRDNGRIKKDYNYTDEDDPKKSEHVKSAVQAQQKEKKLPHSFIDSGILPSTGKATIQQRQLIVETLIANNALRGLLEPLLSDPRLWPEMKEIFKRITAAPALPDWLSTLSARAAAGEIEGVKQALKNILSLVPEEVSSSRSGTAQSGRAPAEPKKTVTKPPASSTEGKPSSLAIAAREAGVDPILLAIDAPAGANHTKAYSPEGLRAVRTSSSNGTEIFKMGLLEIRVVNQGRGDGLGRFSMNHSILPTVTARYDGYNGEIPVRVREMKNGARLLALEGRWKGVLFNQGGERLDQVTEVSTRKMRRAIVADLGLAQIQQQTTDYRYPDVQAVEEAVMLRRKENRVHQFVDSDILPSGLGAQAVSTRRAMVDLLLADQSLAESLTPLLKVEALRPGVTKLLMRILTEQNTPAGLEQVVQLVREGNLEKAETALNEMTPFTVPTPRYQELATLRERTVFCTSTMQYPVTLRLNGGERNAQIRLESADLDDSSEDPTKWVVTEVFGLYLEGREKPILIKATRQAFIINDGQLSVNRRYDPQEAFDTSLNPHQEVDVDLGPQANSILLNLKDGVVRIPANALTQLSSVGTLNGDAAIFTQEKPSKEVQPAVKVKREIPIDEIIPIQESDAQKIVVQVTEGEASQPRSATLKLHSPELLYGELPRTNWEVRTWYTLKVDGLPPFEIPLIRSAIYTRADKIDKEQLIEIRQVRATPDGRADYVSEDGRRRRARLRIDKRDLTLTFEGKTVTIAGDHIENLTFRGDVNTNRRGKESTRAEAAEDLETKRPTLEDQIQIRETEFIDIPVKLSTPETGVAQIQLSSVRPLNADDTADKWRVEETYLVRYPGSGGTVEFKLIRQLNGNSYETTQGAIHLQVGANDTFFFERDERRIEIPKALLTSLATTGNAGGHSLKLTVDPEVEKAEQIAKFIKEKRVIAPRSDAVVDAKVNLFNGAPLEPLSLQLQGAALINPQSKTQTNQVEIREIYQMTSREGFTVNFIVTRVATLSLDQPGGEIKITSNYKPGNFFATLTYSNEFTSRVAQLTLTEEDSNFVFEVEGRTFLVPTQSLAEFSQTGALSENAAPIIYANTSPLSLEVEVNKCGGDEAVIELKDPHRVAPFFKPTKVTYDLRFEGSLGLHRTVAELVGINSATVQAAGKQLDYIPTLSEDGEADINPEDTIRIFGEGNLKLHCLYPDLYNTNIQGVEVFYQGMLVDMATIYNVHEVGSPHEIIRQYIIVEAPNSDRILFYRESNAIDPSGFLRPVSSQEEIDRVNRDLEQHYLTREREDREFKEELKKVDELKETDGQAATEKTKAEAIKNLAKGNPNKFLNARLLVLHDRFARSPFYHEMVVALAQKYAAIAFTGRTPDLKLSDFIREFYIADSRRTAEVAELIKTGRHEKELKKLDKDVLERFREFTEMR